MSILPLDFGLYVACILCTSACYNEIYCIFSPNSAISKLLWDILGFFGHHNNRQ